MSRYCGEKLSEPILKAAGTWRDRALLSEGSVFGERPLWTSKNIELLVQHFVQNLDEGEGNFIEKFEHQLSIANADAKQLAAEMMWVLYLCPSSISAKHKREMIKRVWDWSGDPLSENHPLLTSPLLDGIGSAGPGFNQYFWKELVYFINLIVLFRSLLPGDVQQLMNDGWAFAKWLEGVPDSGNRQFRHMLLFLLFPDDFERIFGQTDRRAVVLKYSGLESRAINKLSPIEVDRALRKVRKDLEEKLNTTQLDFYIPPLKGTWGATDFGEVTSTISTQHVEQAISEIDRGGVPASAQSMYYDLLYKGQRYPAKYVLSLAARYANGKELDRNQFSGGEASPAFRFLRRLGFEIVPKDTIPGLLSKFIAQAKAGTELQVQGYSSQYRELTVKVSFGQGTFSRIPWIAFLAPGQTVSNGIYPVFLYFREQSVLLLCYGVSEQNRPYKKWKHVEDRKTVSIWFHENLNAAPDRYGSSFVREAYALDRALPMLEIVKALDGLIDEYEQEMELSEEPPGGIEEEIDKGRVETTEDLGAAAKSFSDALRAAHVTFGAGHENLIRSVIASLATKPFVILTGLSGSGKSQIAIRLGEWLGPKRLHVAAVRPDWTGAEALFGYEDGLKPALEGRAAWMVPSPLAFMLKAAADPLHPHLLLLDEMNLAHVERYFADVLSGMESGQSCLPNLVLGNDQVWRQRSNANAHIPFPRNLWIVGTVNVDETTYMFSPKVLDRASTFEFRVDSEALNLDVAKPVACTVGDQALVRGLQRIVSNDSWQASNPSSFRELLGEKLRQLHTLLARYGMEFGHRAFYEALRFAAIAEAAGLESMDAVLDCIVIQRILPRVHGSRKRLEQPLLALAHFARDLPEAVASDERLQTLGIEVSGLQIPRLPKTYEKLCRMLRGLRANQFASFTE